MDITTRAEQVEKLRFESAAARSAATFLDAYARACCRHTEAVAECPRCNLLFLVGYVRRSLEVLEDPQRSEE